MLVIYQALYILRLRVRAVISRVPHLAHSAGWWHGVMHNGAGVSPVDLMLSFCGVSSSVSLGKVRREKECFGLSGLYIPDGYLVSFVSPSDWIYSFAGFGDFSCGFFMPR